MTRCAKIVATVGPSSSTVEMLEKLITVGMNVARVNMSHGTYENHAQTIKNIRQASKNTGWEVAVLLDLQGPKIRVDKLPTNIILEAGQTWVIGQSDVADKYPQYKDSFIPTVYKNLVKDAHVGATILFDDGLMEAKAVEKDGDVLKIEIIVGGELKSNKGINLPDVNISAPSFTKKDEEDLLFGLKQGIDYVALSFVRTKADIMQVKSLLHKLKTNTPIVAKIEKPEAVENIGEIIKVADVIMIARGDMGVEVGNHHVPSIQKKIITLCNNVGKPVITATQMLESMTTNARPTRAEASDVANAIWDGSDAVMLSGETAAGKYPVETIVMMNEIIEEAERTPKERPLLRHVDLSSMSASIQVAASIIAEKSHAKWVVAISQSGNSCLKMSRFRPKSRVLGVTNSLQVMRKMAMFWGISPYFFNEGVDDVMTLQEQMIEQLKEQKLVKTGDKIVITHGDGKFFKQGTSNSIRVEVIKDVPREKSGGKSNLVEQKIEGGKILLDSSLCASCQSCLNVCPHDIWEVSMDSRRETKINSENASLCQKDMTCVESCPTGAIEIITTDL